MTRKAGVAPREQFTRLCQVARSALNPEQASVVVRFTDSRFQREESEAEIRRLFPGVRGITVRNMPFRSIFVALAKSAKKGESAR